MDKEKKEIGFLEFALDFNCSFAIDEIIDKNVKKSNKWKNKVSNVWVGVPKHELAKRVKSHNECAEKNIRFMANQYRKEIKKLNNFKKTGVFE